MNRKRTLLLVLLATPFWLSAQVRKNQPVPLINSAEIIANASALYDEGKYREALEELNKVPPGDTNYVRALYEKALTCTADSSFDLGMRYCREGFALKQERNMLPDLCTQYAILLDQKGEAEAALRFLDSALTVYPAYPRLYMAKGTTLFRAGRLADAEAIFQQGAVIDPYNSGFHFRMGIMALQQGKTIPACLALMTSLLIGSEGTYGPTCINVLNSIARSEDEIRQYVSNRKVKQSAVFTTVESIVLSKIAFDKSYKPLIGLDDPITRQIQVILEKLEYDENDDDFYMRYYVPIYTQIFQQKKFEPMVALMFASVQMPYIINYQKKNKKEIQGCATFAAQYFNAICSTRELNPKNRNSDKEIYFYENGKLAGKGVVKQGEFVGDWTFLTPAGNKLAEGRFNEKGQKEGLWRYYYFSGALDAEEVYKEGKLHGVCKYYHDNGILAAARNYVNGAHDGEYRYFNEVNQNTIAAFYKGNKLHGLRTEYTANGTKSSEQNYADGKLHGPVRTFHSNGNVKNEYHYTNGQTEGASKEYFPDGKLAVEGQYANGKQSGTWKYYFGDGRIDRIETYVNGLLEGECPSYYDNGQLYTKFFYKKGNLEGQMDYFDFDGKLHRTAFYENDLIKWMKFFDKSGNLVHESVASDKGFDFVRFTPHGARVSEISFDKKGNIVSDRKDYYTNGNLRNHEKFNSDGQLEGVITSYYPNGNPESEITYSNGLRNGHSTYYFQHGTLQAEGWMVDNLSQGEWKIYHENGNIREVKYLLNDELNGPHTLYWPNGKKNAEYLYSKGHLEAVVQYDTLGNRINSYTLHNGNGAYQTVNVNGSPISEGNYLNGNIHGTVKEYYFNGKPLCLYEMKNGLKEGPYKTYYLNGKIHTEGVFRVDQKEGVWINNYESGELQIREEYKNGKLHGKKTNYFRNGNPRTEIEYKYGSREGRFTAYDETGSLRYVIIYKDDMPIAYTYSGKDGKPVPEIPLPDGNGKVVAYFANGNKSAEFSYVEGKRHGVTRDFHSNGKIWKETNDEYGISEGETKMYYPNGVLADHYSYLHDDLEGYFIEKNEKGQTTLEGHYAAGSFHGEVKAFDDNGKLIETRIYYYGHLLNIRK